ncbi:hypothetical protein LguiB_021711 [Lonicera macranthoides]
MAVVRAQEPSSSSSSSSTCRSLYTYDVFLSFRGEDTRTNFTDHLYTALVDKGIRTFRDYDEIERGKSLKPELEKAIKESRISLIVFSENYAISRWCLDELVMILECRKINSRHVLLPIFYDVSPSEVRKQTGTIGEAFDSATSTANGQGRWWCTSLLLPWVPQLGRGPEILWASLPHSLRNLTLAWCNLSDDSLPSAFSNLSRLKYLDLSYNSFFSLPDCIKSLSSLHLLSLHHCRSLNSILGLPSNLQSLNLEWCDSLRKITFQSTPYQLEETFSFDPDKLVEVDGILKREPVGEVDGRIIKNWGIDIKSIEKLKVKRAHTLSLSLSCN